MKKSWYTTSVLAILLAGVTAEMSSAAPATETAAQKGASKGTDKKGAKMDKQDDVIVEKTLTAVQKQSKENNERGVAALKARNFQVAEEAFIKALEQDPKNLSAIYNLSGVYLLQKQESKAAALLEKYVQNGGDDAGILTRLGDSYFGMKNLTGALATYEKAAKIAPQYPSLQAKLGSVYALSNRMTDAEKAFLKAAEQDPNDPQVLGNLAGVFLANGKGPQAIASAKKALGIRASSDLYVVLGGAYELVKDPANALISYKRAIDLGEKRPEITGKLGPLEKLAAQDTKTIAGAA